MTLEALLTMEFSTPAGIANGILVEASVFAARYTHDTLRSLWEILSSVLEIIRLRWGRAVGTCTACWGTSGPI